MSGTITIEHFVESIDLTTTPASEYHEREARLRGALSARGLDVGFAFGNELFPGDTGWLTGYDPQIEPTAVAIGEAATLLIGGPEGEAYASESSKVGSFRNVTEFKIPEEDYPGYSFVPLASVLAEACGRSPRRVGLLTLPSVVPVSIVRLIESVDGIELVDAGDIMLDLRYHKSPNELAMMRKAAHISTNAMKAMLYFIKPGMRELELAAYAEYVMKAMGADRTGFSTILCSGDRAPNVIGRASNRVMEEGDMVVLGASARFDGLASCIGRTVVLGAPSEAQRRLFDRAVAAFEVGRSQIAHERPASAVDRTVREILDPLGLSPLYSLVHGIGWTEAMEGKGAATQHSEWNFPSGTAFMVDLGIFGCGFEEIPASRLGLRLEDPYVIDHAGETERMTDLPLRCEPGEIYL